MENINDLRQQPFISYPHAYVKDYKFSMLGTLVDISMGAAIDIRAYFTNNGLGILLTKCLSNNRSEDSACVLIHFIRRRWANCGGEK